MEQMEGQVHSSEFASQLLLIVADKPPGAVVEKVEGQQLAVVGALQTVGAEFGTSAEG